VENRGKEEAINRNKRRQMTSGKRWSKLVFILPLLLAATWAANAANTVENFRLKGNTVTALFLALDPLDSCVENFVSVVAADVIQKVSPGGHTLNAGTVLTVVQDDVCNGIELFNGSGETLSQVFQVAGDVTSASLTATVPVADQVSNQIVNVQVNLIWKATGKPVFMQAKDTFRDPELGIKIQTQTRSTQAEATASGTVVADGYNFTQVPTNNATIQKQNDGTLTIQKTQ
jgi:hypothetical protein